MAGGTPALPARPRATLDARVAEHAARAPERTAVVCGEHRLSYRELDDRATRLAAHLREHGVGRGAPVAILLPRGLDIAPAVLGVLKAGAAFVPLDPEYPVQRLLAMLDDIRPDVLVTEARLDARLAERVRHVVAIDRAQAAPARSTPVDDSARDAGADELAYVMYTSGSTGQPRGVMVGHASLACHAEALAHRLAITAEDASMLVASTAFSASVRQYLVPLGQGARVVIASRAEIGDPIALLEAVKRTGVTLLHLVPSHLASVTSALTQLAPERRRALLDNRLRLVATASEVLSPAVAARWLELGHPAALMNLYGLTETTGVFTSHVVERDRLDAARIPIGRPFERARVHVVGDDGRPVRDGEPGELWLAGPLLARGYWGDAQLTAQRFAREPFADGLPERAFRTGDRVVRRPSGELELLGRIDDELKIRGAKVIPGEVASALAQHPEIAEAYAAGEATASGTRLVAYVVARPHATLEASQLRQFLGERLPQHMMPSAFVALPALPRLASGKVDRALQPSAGTLIPWRDAQGAGDAEAGAHAEPRTELERAIAEIWRDVLGIEQVRRDDNFLALGGDSLRAMEVLVRIRMQYDAELALRWMFDEPTVAELARAVERCMGAGDA
jgi:amino acid adenylation domain-containing protein